ncbi:MAG TPA: hypothetical protein PLE19_15600 [Planctomycetota bacterium]|nr:hypothetical protein [Planctomycetota bacterium]HRR79935.1 hypothetical protein [Planctomycetota bacterium]HRT96472.1 hypothetical protein [Planctomycetota bacterium]
MKLSITLAVCFALTLLVAGAAVAGQTDMHRYYSDSGPYIRTYPLWKVPDLTEQARAPKDGLKLDLTADEKGSASHLSKVAPKAMQALSDNTFSQVGAMGYPRNYPSSLQGITGGTDTWQRTSKMVLEFSGSSAWMMEQSPSYRHAPNAGMGYPSAMERYSRPSSTYVR